MPAPSFDPRFVHTVEVEDDFGVRERLQAGKRLRIEIPIR
jgi:hypothetical protein